MNAARIAATALLVLFALWGTTSALEDPTVFDDVGAIVIPDVDTPWAYWFPDEFRDEIPLFIDILRPVPDFPDPPSDSPCGELYEAVAQAEERLAELLANLEIFSLDGGFIRKQRVVRRMWTQEAMIEALKERIEDARQRLDDALETFEAECPVMPY